MTTLKVPTVGAERQTAEVAYWYERLLADEMKIAIGGPEAYKRELRRDIDDVRGVLSRLIGLCDADGCDCHIYDSIHDEVERWLDAR